MNKRPRRSWLWLLVPAFLGLAAQFAMWPAAWADAVYLGVTLPLWSRVSSLLVTAVPGSLSAALALLVVVAFLIALISGRRSAGRAGRSVLWLVVIGIVTFPFVFGLGYHTTTLEERLGLNAPTLVGGPTDASTAGGSAADASAADADAAGASAAGASAAAGLVPLDPLVEASIAAEAVLTVLTEAARSVGAEQADTSAPAVSPATEAAAVCLSAYLPTVLEEPLPTVAGRIKSLPAGWMLRFGFAGVVNPWLLEPHVDAGLPNAAGLAVAMHELAHTAGFAREAEAEAVAILAGMACGDARVRYASSLRAAASFSGLLTPLARESYLARWPAVATADEAGAAAASQRYLSRGAADLAGRAYDTYLGSQGAVGGMDDYARAATIVAKVIGRDGAPTMLPPQ